MTVEPDPSVQLNHVSQALERVRRVLRQERRLQSAHRAEVNERERLGFVSGFVPDSVQALAMQYEDESYFFMVAVRQAIAARAVLVEMGCDLPEIRHEAALVAWRDVLEHWDDAARGVPIRAMKRWDKAGLTERPGSSWTYDSEQGITDLSGVSLPALRSDLEAVITDLKRLETMTFDRAWVTREQAREFIQLDEQRFGRLVGGCVASLDWSHRGGGVGVRYRMSDVRAWKQRLVEQGNWPLN